MPGSTASPSPGFGVGSRDQTHEDHTCTHTNLQTQLQVYFSTRERRRKLPSPTRPSSLPTLECSALYTWILSLGELGDPSLHASPVLGEPHVEVLRKRNWDAGGGSWRTPPPMTSASTLHLPACVCHFKGNEQKE